MFGVSWFLSELLMAGVLSLLNTGLQAIADPLDATDQYGEPTGGGGGSWLLQLI